MTDLRDRARDEADLRQRLTDLAATITTATTWTDLRTHIATSPPPRTPRRLLPPSPLRLAAAAIVVVLAAAALLVAHHDDDGEVDTGDPTTRTTSTTTRPRDTTTMTSLPDATTAPPPPDGGGTAGGPLPSRSGTAGGGQTTPGPRSAPAPTATTWPPVTAIAGPIPAGASPDGNPVALAYTFGSDSYPTLTYHQDGGNAVVDVWLNRGPDGVQHLDRIEVPLGPSSCLVLGTTSVPYDDFGSPVRVIGGVVTTQASSLLVKATGLGQGFISHDVIAPGLRAVFVLVEDDNFRIDALDGSGAVLHSVTGADRVSPETC